MGLNLSRQFKFRTIKRVSSWTRIVAGLLLVGVIFSLPVPAHAATGINSTLNYQGRLLTASGAVVPDGQYNMQFKLYQDGPGNVAGNTGGTLMWTESWVYGVNTPDNRVTVRNGYFSLALGSICAFTSTSCIANSGNPQSNSVVDFNQDTLWLSMNTGNTSSASSFAAASGDGEMLPMRRLGSSVYALNAGKLGGMTAAQFIQNVSPATTQQTANINILSGAAANVAVAQLQAAANATAPVLVLKGGSTPGSGADFLQAQNAAGTVIASINSAGDISTLVGDISAGRNLSASSGLFIGGGAGNTVASIQGTGSAFGTTTTTLALKAIASQTGDLLQLQNSSGSVLTSFDSSGNISFANNAGILSAGTLSISSGVNQNLYLQAGNSATSCLNNGGLSINYGPTCGNISTGLYVTPVQFNNRGIVIQAKSSQNADLLQVQDSSNAVLANIDAGGNINTTGTYQLASVSVLKGAGTANIFVGSGVANANTGFSNTGLGASALQSNVGGSENVAIGTTALLTNIGGNTNTAVGAGAGNASVGNGNVFLGYRAGYSETGSSKLYIANTSTSTPLIYGDFAASTLTVNGSLTSTGDLTFAQGATRTISVQNRTTNAVGNTLVVQGSNAGSGSTGQAGGDIVIKAGSAAGTTGGANGGNLYLSGGSAVNAGTGGQVIVKNSFDYSSAFQVQNAASSALLTVDATTNSLVVNQGTLTVKGLPNPTGVALSTSSSGGSVTAGTYRYLVSATSAAGETQAIASTPASVTTSGSTSVNTLTWTAVPNAIGIAVYRSTNGGTTWFVNYVGGGVTALTDNGSTYTWATSPAGGRPNLFTNNTGLLQLADGNQIRFDTAGNATQKYDSTSKAIVIGNYVSGGGTLVQADNFGFQDTTGYNTNLSISNTGATTFKNRTDSNSAFMVQNASGSKILTVDTASAAVLLGKPGASGLNGTIQFANSSNAFSATLSSGVTSASYTATLPTVIGATGDCLKAGTVTGSTIPLTFAACGGGGGGGVTLQATSPGTPDNGNINVSGTIKAGTLIAPSISGIGPQSAVIGLDTVGVNIIGGANSVGSLVLSSIVGTQGLDYTQHLNVDSSATINLIDGSDVESSSGSWSFIGSSTVQNVFTKGQAYEGYSAIQLDNITAGDGINNSDLSSITSANTYNFSVYAKMVSGTMAGNLLQVTSVDGATHTCTGSAATTLNANGYQRISCSFTATSFISSLKLTQTDSTVRSIYLDAFQLTVGATAKPYTKSGLMLEGSVTSPLSIQNNSDSTTSFQIQNAAGTSNLFVADTLNSKLQLANGTVQVSSNSISYGGTAPASLNFAAAAAGAGNTLQVTGQLGTVGGGIAITGGTGTAGGAGGISIEAGGFTTTRGVINIGASTAADVNIGISGGTTPTISITSGTVNISNETTGTHTIGIGSGNGASNTISVGTSSSTLSLQGNTGASAIVLAAASGGTLKFGSSGVANTITIGNTGAAGAVVQGINIGTNSSATGTNTVTIGNVAATASTVSIQGGTGASAISIAAGSAGTLKFGSSGVANTINIGNNGAAGAVAQTLNIGTNSSATGTNTIVIGNAAATASTISIQGGTGSSAVNINSGANGTVSFGTGSVSNNVNIGNVLSNATTQQINIGNNSNAGATNQIIINNSGALAGTTLINGGNTAGAITLATATNGSIKIASSSNNTGLVLGNSGSVSGVAQTISIGTNSSATGTNTVIIGNSAATASTVTIQGGTGAAAVAISAGANGNIGITTSGTGSVNLSGSVSTTSTAGVTIGTADANQVNLVLDTSSTFADGGTCSSTVNAGGLYYNSSSSSIRACQDSSWSDVVAVKDTGLIMFGIVPDSTTTLNAGDLAGAAAYNSGPCKAFMGASANVVAWNSCVAYSQGRRIVITAGTATASASTTVYQNLCINAAGSQPTLIGTPNANDALASLPTFSVTAPPLCIAAVKTGTSANTINAIYDTRVFTTNTKAFVTVAATGAIGAVFKNNGTQGQYAPIASTADYAIGVLGAYSGTTSTTVPNGILITNGPTAIRAFTGNSGQVLQSTGSGGGYVSGTASPAATLYSTLGIALTDYSASGTSCAVNTACASSIFTELHIR